MAMHFVETTTGNDGQTVSHDIRSYSNMAAARIRVLHPQDKDPFVFVATPEFNDTFRSETEILHMVANWLAKMWVYHSGWLPSELMAQ
jgi:hypothetical protein